MILCIDIGNTSTHWGLVEESGPLRSGGWPTPEMGVHLPILLGNLDRHDPVPMGISFCSVVPQATTVLNSVLAVAQCSWPCHQLTWKSPHGLELLVDVPSEVGADRIAVAVAAHKLFPLPAMVVDMGTAVTVDAVTQNGYAGGIIAPGLSLMTEYLHTRTALLPELDPRDLEISHGLGRNTLDQMKIGCRVGFAGMVEALVGAMESTLRDQGIPPRSLIATGGSAPLLSPALRDRMIVEPELLLRGLHEVWRRSQATR